MREFSSRFVRLSVARMNMACCAGEAAAAYSRISSVIRCELSIRLRSANKESAAEDLYALPSVRTWGGIRATKRELRTLYHFALQSISWPVPKHVVYSPGTVRVRSSLERKGCIYGDLCALEFPCIVLIDLAVPLYNPSDRLGRYRVWIRGECKEGIISFPELGAK